MAINFKTEEFEKIWDITLRTSKMDKDAYDQFIEKSTKEEITKSIIGSYALELIQTAASKGYILDMTYNTVDVLDEALRSIFNKMQNVYTEEAIANIIGRSMASYLILLAVNEENCPCEYQDKYSSIMTEDALDEILDITFSGVAVKTGTAEKAEFLPAALRSIRTKEFDYSDLYINTLPIARAYERATGLELGDYGFMNFLLKKPENTAK